jgi:deoxycytidylate deaminase
MGLCYYVARRSEDEETKVGCVIVDKDNYPISYGYNAFPENIEINRERLTTPEKYFWIEHAERNALYNTIRTGKGIPEGSTMYITWLPCSDCMRGILRSGISRLVVHRQGQELYLKLSGQTNNWQESNKRVMQMIEESGIQFDYLDLKIDDHLTANFRGHEIFLSDV